MNDTVSKFSGSPVDHYIQADVVKKLFSVTKPIPFSELKPDDVENSLFMYHVRKLEDRGVVQRSSEGYSLTTFGVRWINFVGASTLHKKMLPILLVNLIISNSDDTKLLVSKRLGKQAEVLHEYLLPGGLHSYGQTHIETAVKLMDRISHTEIQPEIVTTLEVLHHSPDSFVHHALMLIHKFTLDESAKITDDTHFTYEWVSLQKLSDTKAPYGPLLKAIAMRHLTHSFKAFESLSLTLS